MPTTTRQRLSQRELHALVVQALLHLHDVPWLSESPLVSLPAVQRRCHGSTQLFADGHALAACLREIVAAITDRLDGEGKVAIYGAVLEGVCAGRSIAQIAREYGKTRERFSRHYG